MNKTARVATVEHAGQGVVRVRMRDEVDPNGVIDDLHHLFHECFTSGYIDVLFDMGNVEYPNGSFIAMLIGRTEEARRRGGDVRLINMTDKGRNHINIFTPLTYLSIGLEELSAIEDITSVSPELVKEFVDFRKGEPATLQVAAAVDSLNQITHFVATLGQKAELEHIEQSKLKIAVYEACINVIEHAYKFEPGHYIWIDVLFTGKTFEVTIKDNGSSFDFYNVKSYDVQEAFNGKKKGGYGLYIIKKSVDAVKYETDPQKGNRLTLVKKVG